MSPETIKTIIAIVLLLHGLAFGKAFFELLVDAAGSRRGYAVPVRFWLIPSLSSRATAILASVFWLLSTIGFLGAALSLWRSDLSAETWRQLAIPSAIISTLGIGLVSGIWPGAPTRKMSNLDTVIALVVNAAILIALVILKWP